MNLPLSCTSAALQTELKGSGKVDLRQVWSKAREDFVAERVSDDETVQQIRKFYYREGKYGPYVVDPHTAVGLAATERVIKNASENVRNDGIYMFGRFVGPT